MTRPNWDPQLRLESPAAHHSQGLFLSLPVLGRCSGPQLVCVCVPCEEVCALPTGDTLQEAPFPLCTFFVLHSFCLSLRRRQRLNRTRPGLVELSPGGVHEALGSHGAPSQASLRWTEVCFHWRLRGRPNWTFSASLGCDRLHPHCAAVSLWKCGVRCGCCSSAVR